MPRRCLNPRLAARDQWIRVALPAAERAFQVAYRLAREAWPAGERVVFPAGTHDLRRFTGVAVAPAGALRVFVVDGPPPVPIG